MMMSTKYSLQLTIIVFLGTLIGCTSAPERTISKQQIPYATLPNGLNPIDQSKPLSSSNIETTVPTTTGLIPTLEALRGHALNILELSGGGQNGAFGAGFLKGWE